MLPSRIIVVNDGSSDQTSEILDKASEDHPFIRTLHLPDRGYDIRRVPLNINLATAATDLPMEYLLISGDDCTYPPRYVESLINRMSKDLRIVVASGRPNQSGMLSREHSPSGSGRMVRVSFLRDVGSRFPIRAGWEAWLLFRAAQLGLRTILFSDLVYAHVRPRGSGHQFAYWGAAMYTLGYHPLYALGRIVRTLVKSASLKASTALLRGYLTAALGSSDPFTAPFDPMLRDFVSAQQGRKIGRVVTSVISHGIG
jgi:biofilm PGA synthesis N-glycosyltransferase PgaC